MKELPNITFSIDALLQCVYEWEGIIPCTFCVYVNELTEGIGCKICPLSSIYSHVEDKACYEVPLPADWKEDVARTLIKYQEAHGDALPFQDAVDIADMFKMKFALINKKGKSL